MKKWIALLLVFVLCLSLAACGGDRQPEPESEPKATELIDDWSDCEW